MWTRVSLCIPGQLELTIFLPFLASQVSAKTTVTCHSVWNSDPTPHYTHTTCTPHYTRTTCTPHPLYTHHTHTPSYTYHSTSHYTHTTSTPHPLYTHHTHTPLYMHHSTPHPLYTHHMHTPSWSHSLSHLGYLWTDDPSDLSFPVVTITGSATFTDLEGLFFKGPWGSA